MALPPTIPTSFLPKAPIQAGTSARPTVRKSSGINPFSIIGILLLIIALAGAGGVYAYKEYVTHERDTEASKLIAAQKKIDQEGVQEFIRLRNRLVAGNTLLENHITLSQFFATLESMTLQNVRFNTLELSVADGRTATVKLSGEAKTLNALAAQSSAFSSDPNIKRAIFSGIKANDKTKFIEFNLTADLQPGLVTGGSATVVIDSTPSDNVTVTPGFDGNTVAPTTTTPVTPARPTPKK